MTFCGSKWPPPRQRSWCESNAIITATGALASGNQRGPTEEDENMREFFKGWRRTTGLVTLVLSCGVLAIWLRSRDTEDYFAINTDGITITFVGSSAEGVFWESCRFLDLDEPEKRPFLESIHFFSSRYNPKDRTDFVALASTILTKRTWGGFMFGRTRHTSPSDPQAESVFLAAPHLAIVLPLILLSGWLLFSKPRSSNRHPTITGPKEPA